VGLDCLTRFVTIIVMVEKVPGATSRASANVSSGRCCQIVLASATVPYRVEMRRNGHHHNGDRYDRAAYPV
jgi:hypothetical protein